LISTVVMFQAQYRETTNSTWKVAVSVKIIMTTSVTRSCFITQHQTCKTKTKTTVCKIKTKTDFFWSQTGLVLRPTFSDHITGKSHNLTWLMAINKAKLQHFRSDMICAVLVKLCPKINWKWCQLCEKLKSDTEIGILLCPQLRNLSYINMLWHQCLLQSQLTQKIHIRTETLVTRFNLFSPSSLRTSSFPMSVLSAVGRSRDRTRKVAAKSRSSNLLTRQMGGKFFNGSVVILSSMSASTVFEVFIIERHRIRNEMRRKVSRHGGPPAETGTASHSSSN